VQKGIAMIPVLKEIPGQFSVTDACNPKVTNSMTI
jgi:hypothetical protein